MMERDFHHSTHGVTEPLQNTSMFMSTADRYQHGMGPREHFIREEKERKEKLLQERVVNKNRVLDMYEELKNRAQQKVDNRDTSNLFVTQTRQKRYEEMCRLTEKA
jgi:hypothetical protein